MCSVCDASVVFLKNVALPQEDVEEGACTSKGRLRLASLGEPHIFPGQCMGVRVYMHKVTHGAFLILYGSYFRRSCVAARGQGFHTAKHHEQAVPAGTLNYD